MEVGLAGDDGAGSTESFDQPGVVRGDAVEVAVEVRAAGRGSAGEVEAIFDGDGETPERASGGGRDCFGAGGFGAGPGGVLPEVGVAGCVLVGGGEGMGGERCGGFRTAAQGGAEFIDVLGCLGCVSHRKDCRARRHFPR